MTAVDEWADVDDGDLAGDAAAVHATSAEWDGECSSCGELIGVGECLVLHADGSWLCTACAPKPGISSMSVPMTAATMPPRRTFSLPSVGDGVVERVSDLSVSARCGVVVRTGVADGVAWVDAVGVTSHEQIVVHHLNVDQLDPARTQPASAAIATQAARAVCRALGQPQRNVPFTADEIDYLYCALALLHDHAGVAA